MLSPHAQGQLGRNKRTFFSRVDAVATRHLVSLWQVPPHDVACSGDCLSYTRNEADVQIELRYTVGEGPHKQGEVFNPTLDMQSEMSDRIMADVAPILAEYQLICSVWCKPHANSKFTIPGSSDWEKLLFGTFARKHPGHSAGFLLLNNWNHKNTKPPAESSWGFGFVCGTCVTFLRPQKTVCREIYKRKNWYWVLRTHSLLRACWHIHHAVVTTKSLLVKIVRIIGEVWEK